MNEKYEEILKFHMKENDAGAETIGEYLSQLLVNLIDEGEGFSSKRPFGNSGWIYELYLPLVDGGFVEGSLDEDGYLEEIEDSEAACQLLMEVVQYALIRK